MAAKKDKGGIEGLRADIQSLSDAFSTFRNAMLTDAAVAQSEQQQQDARLLEAGDLTDVSDADFTEAASLMAAIGHPQRLRMTVMLAQGPVSVNEIVQQLGLKTTGAAYHHLNVLTNHGIAEQPQRGTFALAQAHAPRVLHLLEALFGITASTPEDSEDDVKSTKKKKSKS